MASPRTRRVLADLKPKDENSVSFNSKRIICLNYPSILLIIICATLQDDNNDDL